jgi:hypothetical protein
MKAKLSIAFMLLACGSAFAQTRWSSQIGGGYGPRYYAPPPTYYAPAQPDYHYRPYGYAHGWGGAGYWGENPERHRSSHSGAGHTDPDPGFVRRPTE